MQVAKKKIPQYRVQLLALVLAVLNLLLTARELTGNE
jgi:hypothetical protein